jgi:lysozyme family protein
MQANYSTFIRRVISRYEGNYCWDAGDAGGPTKYGITCYDLAEYLGKRMQSMAAWAPIVRAMALSTAENIYANKYARRDRFNDLESGSDCVILDYGINSGVLRPVWIAQKITGRPRTNVFSDDLVKAINDYSANRFIDRMCDERMVFLRSLSVWPRFRGGWTTRVADLRNYCHNISSDLVPPVANDTITDRIPTIKTAQRQYNELYSLQPPLDIDGFEGPKTKAITRRFQQEHDLEVDGLIGEHTMAKLVEAMPPAHGLRTLFEDEAPAAMAKGLESTSDIFLEYEH